MSSGTKPEPGPQPWGPSLAPRLHPELDRESEAPTEHVILCTRCGGRYATVGDEAQVRAFARVTGGRCPRCAACPPKRRPTPPAPPQTELWAG